MFAVHMCYLHYSEFVIDLINFLLSFCFELEKKTKRENVNAEIADKKYGYNKLKS